VLPHGLDGQQQQANYRAFMVQLCKQLCMHAGFDSLNTFASLLSGFGSNLSTAPCTCATAAAAFNIQAVTLEPEVVPPAGTLKLLVDVINKQPSVTAGEQLHHCSAYSGPSLPAMSCCVHLALKCCSGTARSRALDWLIATTLIRAPDKPCGVSRREC
jgi:hypothetical protein